MRWQRKNRSSRGCFLRQGICSYCAKGSELVIGNECSAFPDARGSPIGVVLLMRRSPKPFSDRQIELVETFADQAVIAIENVRRSDEFQAQKRESTETLEHQTAPTSEVLSAISRSPTNAQPVFDAIAGESAARLCEAVFTAVWLYDGDLFHHVSSHNFTVEVLDQINKSLGNGRIAPWQLDGRYWTKILPTCPICWGDPVDAHELATAGNRRSSPAVPMLRDGKSVRRFPDRPKQVPLKRGRCSF